LCVVN
jgi:hypothetical protein